MPDSKLLLMSKRGLRCSKRGVVRLNEPITSLLSNAPTAKAGGIASSERGERQSVKEQGVGLALGLGNYPLPKAIVYASPSLTMPQPDTGRKYDAGKPPLVQGCFAYFGRALRGVAEISAYGAKKYAAAFSDQNWRKVDNAKGRYADALLRHLEAWTRGEDIDAESGKPHIDMVAWNALALSELEKA